jgi:outer membrane protease
MKKTLIVPAVALAVVSSSAQAAFLHWSNVSFRVEGSVGLVEGKAHERVYVARAAGGERLLSELEWDLSELLMVGGSASVVIHDRLRFRTSLCTAVNEGDGSLVDTDWLVEGLPWTHRSVSDVDVKDATVFDFQAAYRVLDWRGAAFHGILGYRHSFWEWRDSVRYYVYSITGFRDFTAKGDGSTLVDYEQVFSIPYAGVEVQRAVGSMDVAAWLLFSPAVRAKDEDTHLARGIRFRDSFYHGDFISVGTAAAYRLGDRLTVGLRLEYEEIPEIRGDLVAYAPGQQPFRLENAAGISHRSGTVTATAAWTF